MREQVLSNKVVQTVLQTSGVLPHVAMDDVPVRTPDDQLELISLIAPAQAEGGIGRLGHYRVLKVLGKGGMGMVLLAEDTHLLRLAAVKIMLRRFALDSESRDRFLREARAAARLKNDNIVTIFQVSEERGIPFIAMEYLKGLSLEQYLQEKGELSIEQAVQIGRGIAKGLQSAHEAGLVHRDIKPGNIWLEAPKGRVKILDFGLARETRDEKKLTQHGTIVGTPLYMSPEQANGGKLDSRSDLFSFGVLLYRLCTGRQPFDGPSAVAVLMAISSETPTPVREINPEIPTLLADLIDSLLVKQPSGRLASASKAVHILGVLSRPRDTSRTTSKGSPDDDDALNNMEATAQINIDVPSIDLQFATTALRPRKRSKKRKKADIHHYWILGAAALALLVSIFFVVRGLRRDTPRNVVQNTETTRAEKFESRAIQPRYVAPKNTETLKKEPVVVEPVKTTVMEELPEPRVEGAKLEPKEEPKKEEPKFDPKKDDPKFDPKKDDFKGFDPRYPPPPKKDDPRFFPKKEDPKGPPN